MERKNWICIAFLMLVFVCYLPVGLYAQAVDYSKIKVESLSDDQVLQMMARAGEQGMSASEMYSALAAEGMSSNEITKLQARVYRLTKTEVGDKNLSVLVDPTEEGRRAGNTSDLVETSVGEVQDDGRPKVFGADLFRNGNIRFEPSLNMPTPVNYVVGPGDQLNLDITGDNEASYKPIVSPEGTIRVEYIGMIDVAGLTIEDLRSKLRNTFSTVYPGLRSGRTRLDVNLGNIRSIKIVMTGYVTQSGTYTLPSVATVYNALYAAGGPSSQGSYRNIQVIRNNEVIQTIDAYDFLVNGKQTGNIRLEDQDVIHVPVYQARVEFQGLVKNPGLFEVKEDENLSDILKYAGGFAPNAYTAKVKVFKTTDRDRRIRDVYASEFSNYEPKNGDQYIVEEILDRYSNRVQIEGAVFRPGYYELTDGLTVRQLIDKGDGVKEDAFLERGYINRLNPDNTQRLISFDLQKLLNGEIDDIQLQREDRVIISSIFDLREEYNFSINGEVRKPGMFKYADDMTLGNAIHMAGGLTDAANIERVEVARRIRRNVNERDSVLSELLIVNFDSKEQALQSDFELKPFDIVNIRVSTGYLVQKQVRIEGEVKYPGVYTLTKKDERISDLIERAGGFTDFAYLKGASLRRTASDAKISNDNILAADDIQRQLNREQNASEALQMEALGNLEEQGAHTSLTFSNYVGIELDRIVKNPHSRYDLLMEDGDVVLIPRELQTISVKGQVLNANRIRYQKGKPLSYYIDQAGGFTANAHKKKVFVQYANGEVAATRSGLGRAYPKVEPGAEIIVPAKPVRPRTDARTMIGLTSGIVSMTAIIVSLFRR